MPKKFQGENSKAVTARARKAEAKAVADARKKQQEEDALWEETDKHVLKKEQRKVGKASFFLVWRRAHFWIWLQDMWFSFLCVQTKPTEPMLGIFILLSV